MVDQTSPAVGVDVWYRVGGANDPPGRSGFAHLFEHLMFQGTEGVPMGQFDALLRAVGGDNNASTRIDVTDYIMAIPARHLPLGLWLEADRMRALAVDEEKFHREREVVKEEFRLRIENQPYGAAFLRSWELTFQGTAYERPTIGSIADLDRATFGDVLAFHRDFYKPNNATLVVAGDFDVATARDLIDEYFAPIPRRGPPPSLAGSDGLPTGRREEAIADELASVPQVTISYAVPGQGHADFPAVAVLGTILSTGEASRFEKGLLDQGLASSASAYVVGGEHWSYLAIDGMPNEGVETARIEQSLQAELTRLWTEPVTADELEIAKGHLRSGRVRALEGVLGLADAIQAAYFYQGDPHAALPDVSPYDRVSREDVQRVAESYLTPERQAIVRVVPGLEDEE